MQAKPVEFLPTRLSIHPTAFVAGNCTLRGEVSVGALSSLWFSTVLRADTAPIRIGERSNIQDGSVLHVDLGMPVEIGNDVTVGHAAVVHGARVADEVLIAMRATVLSGAVIGRHCIIGAGALLTEGFRRSVGTVRPRHRGTGGDERCTQESPAIAGLLQE